MELEAITSRFVQKDFWDLAEILEYYSLQQLTAFYMERYPWNDLREVMERVTQFEKCEESKNFEAEVVCINGKTWNDVKQSISEAFDKFVQKERELNKIVTPSKSQNKK